MLLDSLSQRSLSAESSNGPASAHFLPSSSLLSTSMFHSLCVSRTLKTFYMRVRRVVYRLSYV
jgi:hypothetical protein